MQWFCRQSVGELFSRTGAKCYIQYLPDLFDIRSQRYTIVCELPIVCQVQIFVVEMYFWALVRDGCRTFVAPVTFQLLWGIYFKRIGQLANNYCTVLHIVSFVLFFSELAKCPQESLIFFKFIINAVKIGIETLSKPILENHKIVWKALYPLMEPPIYV